MKPIIVRCCISSIVTGIPHWSGSEGVFILSTIFHLLFELPSERHTVIVPVVLFILKMLFLFHFRFIGEFINRDQTGFVGADTIIALCVGVSANWVKLLLTFKVICIAPIILPYFRSFFFLLINLFVIC